MRFPFPLLPAEFEIPDEWWTEAGMTGFKPSGSAYRSTAAANPISLRDIEPPCRYPEHPLDWHSFNRARLISVLNGIAAGDTIEPVPVAELQPIEFLRNPYRYRVKDGFHRFYASVAAGFECLPVTIP